MATTTVNTNFDGTMKCAGLIGTGWDNCHDQTTGQGLDTTAVIGFSSIKRGAFFSNNIYHMYRTFMSFDVSSISTTVSEATLTLKINGTPDLTDMIIVKSSHDGSDDVVVADFNKLCDGECSSGYDDGDMTAYTAEFSTSGGGDIDVDLNSDALSDIQSEDYFTIALINHDYDYLDVEPSSLTLNQTFNTNWQMKETGGYDGAALAITHADAVAAGVGKIVLSSGKVTLSSGKITF